MNGPHTTLLLASFTGGIPPCPASALRKPDRANRRPLLRTAATHRISAQPFIVNPGREPP